jgi:hypothetical protein
VSDWRGHGTVPFGWEHLVDGLDSLVRVLDPAIRVTQVKQKLGGLSYSYELSPQVQASETRRQAILEIQLAVERASHTVCEGCGGWGRVREKDGWYRTLCESCNDSWRRSRFLRTGLEDARTRDDEELMQLLESLTDEPDYPDALTHRRGYPDPAALDPVPAWVLEPHAWEPGEIGLEVRLAYIDRGVEWVDAWGSIVLPTHPFFPSEYAENLLAFLRDRYAKAYEDARGRSIEEAELVQAIKTVWRLP